MNANAVFAYADLTELRALARGMDLDMPCPRCFGPLVGKLARQRMLVVRATSGRDRRRTHVSALAYAKHVTGEVAGAPNAEAPAFAGIVLRTIEP